MNRLLTFVAVLVVVGCRHAEPTPFSDDAGRTGFKDRDGRVVVAPQFEAALEFGGGLCAVKQNGRWGFVDSSGTMVIPPRFTAGGVFDWGSAVVGDGAKAVRITSKGDVMETFPLTPLEGGASEGLRAVPMGGHSIRDVGLVDARWGFVDAAAVVVVAPRFAHVGAFSQGVAPAEHDGLYGLINRDGAWVLRPTYADMHTLVEGRGAVNVGGSRAASWTPTQGGLWGFVDARGSLVVPARYTQVRDFSEGVAYAERPGYRGFIRPDGAEGAPMDAYNEIGPLKEGRARVIMPDRRSGYVDATGKLVIPLRFIEVHDFEDGAARVCAGTWPTVDNPQAVRAWKCGFIGLDGSVKVPLIHESFMEREGRHWVVNAEGKYGILSPDLKAVTPLEYQAIGHFVDGVATMRRDGLWGLIRLDGTVVTPPTYDAVGYFSDGKIAVQKGKLWGYLDSQGREFIPPRYEAAYAFENGRAVVVVDGKERTIDDKGNVVAP